jgi:hypothetical protein
MRKISNACISLHYPSNNDALTQYEYAAAKYGISSAMRLVLERDGAVVADVDMPDGNWKLGKTWNSLSRLTRLIADSDYATINNLRYHTNEITGIKPLYFSGYKVDTVSPFPNDCDEIFINNIFRLAPFFLEYIDISRRIPCDSLIYPPNKCCEVGFKYNDVIVNMETLRYQSNLSTLWELGVINYLENIVSKHGKATVIEIGGGYGAFAYYMKQTIPGLNYIIIDIPETLMISAAWLSINMVDTPPVFYGGDEAFEISDYSDRVILVPNYKCDLFLNIIKHADLVLNYASFGEMTADQVRKYGKISATLLGDSGYLVESNQSNMPHTHSVVSELLSESFENSWKCGSTFRQIDGKTTVWSNSSKILDVLKSNPALVENDFTDICYIMDILVPSFPQLVVHGYNGYNILRWGNSFYGIRQNYGAFNPARVYEFGPLIRSGDLIISSECDDIERKIDALLTTKSISRIFVIDRLRLFIRQFLTQLLNYFVVRI